MGYENMKKGVLIRELKDLHQRFELEKAEVDLRENENLFDDFFRKSPIGFHIFGPDEIIKTINQAELDMIGYSHGEIVGKKRWKDLIVPEQIPRFEDHWRMINDSEISKVFNLEYTLIHKNGLNVTVLLSASGRYDSHGKLINTRGNVIDITKRKMIEEKLRENEVFLDSIIKYLPNMIFVKDAKELRFQLINKAGEMLLGYKREDLIGKNDYDLFPKEQANFFIKKDREVLRSGKLKDIPEEPIKTKYGERILHTKKIPIFDKKGSEIYLLGISEDITERKRLEDRF